MTQIFYKFQELKYNISNFKNQNKRRVNFKDQTYIVAFFFWLETMPYFLELLLKLQREMSRITRRRSKQTNENKSVTLTALDGHALNIYKNYKAINQIVPKSEGDSVKVTLEYEKLNENVPPPTKYLDFIVDVFEVIDAHLLKA